MHRVKILIKLRYVIVRKLLVFIYLYCLQKLFASGFIACRIHRIEFQKLFACISVDIL